jgi:hypothetical protein
MTDWRAVGIGFLVSIVAGIVAFALPVVGHIGAGLIGGGVAGYLAESGIGSGAWHGLLAGAVGGIVLALLFGLGAGFLGSIAAGPGGGLLGAGVFVVGVIIAFVLAIDSAIGGAVGGLLAS